MSDDSAATSESGSATARKRARPAGPTDDDIAAAERALLDQLAALEYSNSSLRLQLTDAREAAVAHAEARLMASRARHAPRADVERALLDVLSARDARPSSPHAPLATREARVRALLTPPSAADWDASDPGAAAALAAGGGAAVADLSTLRVR